MRLAFLAPYCLRIHPGGLPGSVSAFFVCAAEPACCRTLMSSGPAIPNQDLAELVALLGEDNVRLLVRTFLREYPSLLANLAAGDRKTRHRLVHSLKSNARIVGAREVSEYMAAIEDRLSQDAQPDLSAAEVADISARFQRIAESLRVFAGVP